MDNPVEIQTPTPETVAPEALKSAFTQASSLLKDFGHEDTSHVPPGKPESIAYKLSKVLSLFAHGNPQERVVLESPDGTPAGSEYKWAGNKQPLGSDSKNPDQSLPNVYIPQYPFGNIQFENVQLEDQTGAINVSYDIKTKSLTIEAVDESKIKLPESALTDALAKHVGSVNNTLKGNTQSAQRLDTLKQTQTTLQEKAEQPS